MLKWSAALSLPLAHTPKAVSAHVNTHTHIHIPHTRSHGYPQAYRSSKASRIKTAGFNEYVADLFITFQCFSCHFLMSGRCVRKHIHVQARVFLALFGILFPGRESMTFSLSYLYCKSCSLRHYPCIDLLLHSE